MTRASCVLLLLPIVFGACASGGRGADSRALPQTRAERSGFTETSTHADVVAFLDSLGRGFRVARGSVGTTSEGRDIPYVVASRPLYATPAAARGAGRPIVYVQGNIHAGEIEGKEALQALLRDLLADPKPNVLDSIVLVAVPIYNGDGNEKFDIQARNRGAQNGPAMVGQRPNAQGLDLNRDYMKAAAPETRGSLATLNAWDPHVFVDLHTTNGSYHGYHLTWAPSLNPAAEIPGATFGAAYARDSLLPEVQRRVKARHDVNIFPYGNFAGDAGPGSVPTAWQTYDHRPRFGTNYYALRGRISVLSEAYSHDPFATRVRATWAFVRELLSLVAERGASIRALAATSDAAVSRWGGSGVRVPMRATLTTTPRDGDVIYEVLERTTDTTRREPGVRPGMRRTGQFVTTRMPIHDRFVATRSATAPWGYVIPASDTATLALVALHGLRRFITTSPWTGNAGEQFSVDSVIMAPRPFQNRREVRLEGRWANAPLVTVPTGSIIVPVGQPLGAVAMYLLEPESDDGIVNWDIGDRAATAPRELVITRLARDPGIRMRPFLR